MSGPMKAMGLLGLGATAFLWSQNSIPEHWEHEASRVDTNAQFQKISSGWAIDSGSPVMDEWARSIKEIPLTGPFLAFKKAKVYVDGFINDAVIPSLLPTALTAVALGIGFENEIRAGLARLRGVRFPWGRFFGGLGRAFGQILSTSWRGFVKPVLGTVGKFFIQSKGAGLAILGVLGVGALKFNDIYNGTAQRELFSHGIATAEYDRHGTGF
jgi:hypothetical protein